MYLVKSLDGIQFPCLSLCNATLVLAAYGKGGGGCKLNGTKTR